ncbi:MAG: hypothetical protein HC867_09640 [Bacteroidia bacterium]|nr:hypothetical protein [Bacteroidia bacterium]
MLTRETDVYQSVKDIANYTAAINPDVFISIHANAEPPSATRPEQGGFELFISQRNKISEQKSRLLGSLIVNEIKKSYTTSVELKQRKEAGIWVLDASTVNYPSMMILCGYMTNKNDLAFIKGEKNQESIAGHILDAIEKFSAISSTDTLPKRNSKNNTIKPNPDNDSPGKSAINTVNNGNQSPNPNSKLTSSFSNSQPDPLYVIDGKFMGKGAYAKAAIDASVKPEDISAIDVIKGEKAIQLYGENGKDGVISITTKKFEKSPFGTYEGKKITLDV